MQGTRLRCDIYNDGRILQSDSGCFRSSPGLFILSVHYISTVLDEVTQSPNCAAFCMLESALPAQTCLFAHSLTLLREMRAPMLMFWGHAPMWAHSDNSLNIFRDREFRENEEQRGYNGVLERGNTGWKKAAIYCETLKDGPWKWEQINTCKCHVLQTVTKRNDEVNEDVLLSTVTRVLPRLRCMLSPLPSKQSVKRALTEIITTCHTDLEESFLLPPLS